MASKFTFDTIREKGLLIYEYIRGSHAYGLATETSDEDRGGVYICPPDELLGLGFEYQTQVDNPSHDIVWMELNRFLRLLVEKSNPTCLEALYIPDRCVIYEHPIMTEIKKHRDLFLTKACFNAFGGYSHQQIIKARGLNKKIVNPMKCAPKPLNFAYVPYKQGSSRLENWLEYRHLNQKYCGAVAINNMENYYGVYYDFFNFFKFENISKEDCIKAYCDKTDYDTIKIVREWKESMAESEQNPDDEVTERVHAYEEVLNSAQLKNMMNFIVDKFGLKKDTEAETVEMFSKWFDELKPIGYCGLVGEKSNELRHYEYVEHAQKDDESIILCSVPKNSVPICHMSYNKNGYSASCKKWREYTQWEKERNPERYRTNVEHNKGYDSKNMSHCLRLLNCATEIAQTGVFNVDRTNIDRDLLLSIKKGEYPYDMLIEMAEKKDKEMREAMENSKLPEKVDADAVNKILLDIRYKQIKKEL